MDKKKALEEALNEMATAEAMIDQAKQKYYSAKKKLESIYSPASPKRGILSQEEIAKLLYKRPRKKASIIDDKKK